jgi:dTDP-4-amino-4,6-dideoxygalactose transaminase
MIPHNRPTLGAGDREAVAAVLKSGWIAPGARVKEFEEGLAGFLGSGGSATAVETGTAALHLALEALEIGNGDEVILPTYVCSAVLNAVHYAGAHPVLADIGPSGFNISPEDVRKKLSTKTGAIIVPHLYGSPAEIQEICELGPPVIEDCAQSLGATVVGRMTGTVGECSICSFYATKLLTTGKGGAIFSRRRDLMNTVRDLVDFDCRPSYRVRYNYRMNDLQAALGISQLRKLEEFIEKRRSIAAAYHRILDGTPGVLAARPRDGTTGVWYRYVISSRRDPAEIKERFRKEGIAVINPLEPWELLHRYLRLNPAGFPNAERAAGETISVPIYPSLTPAEIARIGEALGTIYGA